MRKRLSIIPLGACFASFLCGCNPDHSGDTREVSTPNPPFKSMANPNADKGTPGAPIQNSDKIPDKTKETLSHVVPGMQQQPGK